ncbi:hypothetical protein BECAL_01069 [Bellilinea caldifistulae]|uniref:Glycosyltransferase RgtA/B/C/D-like domain-containing protein n=1 Tax=Bellilinea caldifistulae TaxID=360411 RepID=A0A0P6XIS5_9CHLR|nr:hypothetical protein [Bellilinea caldifistulae]KPL75462.1 hypothetical protein AC812_09355 [Bellilinea caldifistulae]GAP09915.1 hypothetical protein BECAL_01069 [Bellilinea caldifistulae]
MSRAGWKRLIGILMAALLGGLLLNGLAEQRFSLQGWLSSSVLLSVSGGLLWFFWQMTASPRRVGWAVAVAFLLRLFVGIGLSLALPVWGHDSEVSKAGYLFFDAFTRDRQAWELATSGQSLLAAFGNEFSGDQYGGMLAASALIYRLLSPDLHRPYLILILTAFAAAAAVPFFYAAVKRYFGAVVAALAVWIYVLYPESVLLGASQMRDPVLIGLAGVALWLVSRWQDAPRRVTFGLVGIVLLTAVFSYLVALPLTGLLFLWWWLEYSSRIRQVKIRRLVWLFVAVSGVLMLAGMAAWLRESALWDARLTESGSGKIQALFEALPDPLELPFLVVYGLLQPVLPAALFDPSKPLWTVISTLRSLGWYGVLPLLAYAPLGMRFEAKGLPRRLIFWTFLIVVGWSLLSSFRAGGDLWDNPRYRTLLLPWLAMLAAWSFVIARQQRDIWLPRLLACEGIFVCIFGIWYANRSFQLGLNFSFFVAAAVTAVLCGLVVIIGYGYDRRRRLKPG